MQAALLAEPRSCRQVLERGAALALLRALAPLLSPLAPGPQQEEQGEGAGGSARAAHPQPRDTATAHPATLHISSCAWVPASAGAGGQAAPPPEPALMLRLVETGRLPDGRTPGPTLPRSPTPPPVRVPPALRLGSCSTVPASAGSVYACPEALMALAAVNQ